MKDKQILKIMLACVAIFGLGACENEPLEGEFGETTNPTLNSNFQVDIDSATYVADQAIAQTFMGNTSITASTVAGERIELIFNGSGTGTFSLVENGSATYKMAGDSIPFSTNFENMTGEITITDYNLQENFISGTFSFEAARMVDPENDTLGLEIKEFTNGVFSNVPLQSDDTETQQENFEVELNGELYVGESIQANLNSNGLIITATNGVRLMGIQIFDPAVGSFDLGNEQQAIIMYDTDNTDEESLAYGSIEGTMNITALDEIEGTVSGDFSGILEEFLNAAENIEMTNGVFENLSLSTQESPNSATAMIDGEPFEATFFTTAFAAGKVQVEFSNDLDESIYLVFPSGVSGGTYPITNSPEDYSGRYVVDVAGGTNEYGSVEGTGEIVINSIEGNVLVGSFYFDAESDLGETVSITEGEFTIDLN